MSKLDKGTSSDAGDMAGYDAVVSTPTGENRQSLLDKAMKGAGLDQAKAEALVDSLSVYGAVKLKSNVSLAAAQEIVQRFVHAGFVAEAVPVLALSAQGAETAGSEVTCPACGAHVHPTPEDECPQCGIFLHKVSADILARKKIEIEEKRKIDLDRERDEKAGQKSRAVQHERLMRERVRADLERQYGLDKGQGGQFLLKNRNLLLGLALVLLVVSFGMGRFGPGTGGDAKAAKEAALKHEGQTQAEQQMVSQFVKSAGSDEEKRAALAMTMAGNMAQTMAVVGAAGAMTKAALGGGAAEGSMAGQPVASQSLASDPTASLIAQAEGSAPIAQPGAASAAPAAAPNPGAASRAVSAPASSGAPSGSAGSPVGVAGPAASAPPPPVPARNTVLLDGLDRLQAMSELAVTLAELEQIERAREVVGRMFAVIGKTADLDSAMLLRQSRVRVEAWALVYAPAENVQARLNSLAAAIEEIPRAGYRATEYAEVAAILAQSPFLPSAEAEKLFTLAGKAFELEKDEAKRHASAGILLSARGRALLVRIKLKGARGFWTEATGLTRDLDAMVAKAQEPEMAARLLGYNYQAKRLLGQKDEAQKNLTAALAQAIKLSDPESRTSLLRWLYNLPDAQWVASMATSLDKEYRAADQLSPRVDALVLGEVALAYASVGKQNESVEVMSKLAILVNSSSVSLTRQLQLQKALLPLAWARYYRSVGLFGPMEEQIKQSAKAVL